MVYGVVGVIVVVAVGVGVYLWYRNSKKVQAAVDGVVKVAEAQAQDKVNKVADAVKKNV